jgi:mono/diheme cytochrome c family protein
MFARCLKSSVGRRVARFAVAVAVFMTGIGVTVPSNMRAQQTKTVADGVYTAAQAERGQAIYKERCAPCHGATLQGQVGPPLTGPDFLADFSKQPLTQLFGKIKITMPLNAPGSLTPQQAGDVVAFILQAGKFPAGSTDLVADDSALQQITWPGGLAAAQPAASGPAPSVAFPPIANLGQLMKGIMFPSSNIIFNVQTKDPGTIKEGYQSGNGAFSWVDWGAGIYPGWELVDNAALSIAEAAPLLLTPNRRCENGRRVPVERPDWIKFTQELVAAAQVAYRASQMRSQDAVSDATERLSDACFNCHIVYRDKAGGNVPLNLLDPSNKAARCVQ